MVSSGSRKAGRVYLAIDPGNDTGWALYRGYDQLLVCGLGDPRKCYDSYITFGGGVTLSVIIEKPMVYRARLSRGNPNDLITLAIGVGEYKEFFQSRGATVKMVLPHEWKGSVPKDAHNKRVIQELGPSDLAVLESAFHVTAKSKWHNVVDAVALGRGAFQQKLW